MRVTIGLGAVSATEGVHRSQSRSSSDPADRQWSDRDRLTQQEIDRRHALRYEADPEPADRYAADRYATDRYAADRHATNRYPADRYRGSRQWSDRDRRTAPPDGSVGRLEPRPRAGAPLRLRAPAAPIALVSETVPAVTPGSASPIEGGGDPTPLYTDTENVAEGNSPLYQFVAEFIATGDSLLYQEVAEALAPVTRPSGIPLPDPLSLRAPTPPTPPAYVPQPSIGEVHIPQSRAPQPSYSAQAPTAPLPVADPV